jgi:peptidoglycan LD-endopeptidase LytH
MNRTQTRVLLTLSILASAIPALAQVTDDDVRRARQELDRTLEQSQALGDQVQMAWARQLELEHEISVLESSISHARIQLAEAEHRLGEVAIEMYMSAASGLSVTVVINTDSDSYHAGMEYLRGVSGSEDSLISQLRVFRGELERQTERFREASAEQEAVTAELQVMAAELLEDVAAAQVFYDELVIRQREEEEQRQEEERRRQEEERLRREEEQRRLEAAPTTTTTAPTQTVATTAPTTTTTIPTTTTTDGGDGPEDSTTTSTTLPPPPAPGGSCPVAGPASFSDTWGAPRLGGRSHQGVDMIAARGTPIVAILDGTIHRMTTGALSGYAVWLRANNGDQFFYAHLDSYGDIEVGQRVPQGHVIGYNGSTGNAPDWLPHLHFEFHPGGGAAVNPFPLVRSIC